MDRTALRLVYGGLRFGLIVDAAQLPLDIHLRSLSRMVSNVLAGYIGPETILPLASFFAAIVGALLVCWRYVMTGVSRVVSLVTGRKRSTDSAVTPATPGEELRD
jgi:hypothetical protein